MTKLNDKNRSFVFLAGILIIGALLTGFVFLIENEEVGRNIKVDDPPKTNSLSLERKIANLNDKNFTPSIYSTLSTEIETSHSQDLITRQVKENLAAYLKTKYVNLVYNRCESFLTGRSSNTSNEIYGFLRQVEGITGSSQRIDRYREQIRLYEYYTNGLPAKVERFLRAGIAAFDEPTYMHYKSELETMPGLDPKSRNTPNLKNIRRSLISRLILLYNQWSEPAPELGE